MAKAMPMRSMPKAMRAYEKADKGGDKKGAARENAADKRADKKGR